MKLWVDDVRPAPYGYRTIRSVNEAKETIKTYEIMRRVSGGKRYYIIELILTMMLATMQKTAATTSAFLTGSKKLVATILFAFIA